MVGAMTTMLPCNIEAEEAVIGSVLVYPPAYNEASKHIIASDFYIERNQWIWRAIEKITKNHSTVDIVTISDELKADGKLDNVGGQKYLLGLVNNTPSAMNAEHYAKIVASESKRRRMITLAGDLAKTAFDESKDLDGFIPVHIGELLKAISSENQTEHISVGLSELYDDIVARAADPKDIYGISTGIPGIDRITGGLQKTELFLLSGEPGLGKSILAMQMAFSMAKAGHPGVIYELEMSKKQTLRRTLSVEAHVRVRAMKTGRVTDDDMASINEGLTKLEALPLYFSDSTSWNTASLRSDLTRAKQLYGIEWFVVDYLRLLKDRFDGKEPERIGTITTNLHDICRDLDLAGLVIQNMTKAGFGSEPGMENVYGGSELQYACDVIAIMGADSRHATDGSEIVNLDFDKIRESEDGVRLIKLVKRPGFPMFAEMERAAK